MIAIDGHGRRSARHIKPPEPNYNVFMEELIARLSQDEKEILEEFLRNANAEDIRLFCQKEMLYDRGDAIKVRNVIEKIQDLY
jgi:hypothetical protein